MKKLIIGGLVGGIILFIWQFVSWSFTGIHSAELQYTENENEILAALDGKLEDGTYFLPGMAPGSTSEEHQAKMQANVGKPWAHISYHNSMESSMGMNMTRGIIVDIIAAMLLAWILMQFTTLDMKTAVLASLAAGLIGYLTISYTNGIWFQNSTMGQLIDTIVAWTLCGAWLGFWLKK